MTRAADPRFAWLMVAVCAAMVAMAFGAVTILAVFLTPLAAEFGWPRGDLSLAYAIATIGTGLGGILMGHYADRVSVRHVALCGAIVPGVALVFLSQMDSKGELYVFHALMGVLGVGACLAPLSSLASQWLARNPGLAIGIVSAGGALGQGLIPFFARHLVVLEGWRHAYLALGLAYILMTVPLALLLRAAPHPAVPGSAAARALAANPYGRPRGQMLAWLSLAALLCCICMATPIVHVASLGSDRGLGGRDAAGLLAVMMVCAMAGRVFFGRISDRTGSLPTYLIASVGQTLLAFLFPYARTATELYVLSALFGLIYSGAQTGFILCAREYAPAGATARSIGLVMSFAWLGMALGAWQGGVFYDLCGNYVPSFSNAALAGAANLLILALLYLYTFQKPLNLGRFRWLLAKS